MKLADPKTGRVVTAYGGLAIGKLKAGWTHVSGGLSVKDDRKGSP